MRAASCCKRRGGEGRRRVARRGLGLDRLDGEAAVLDVGLRLQRIALVADRQAVDLVAVPLDQPRGERRAVLLERRGDRPIFLRGERLDLALAVDDQAQRDRLDAARRLGAGQLAPQHRAEREPDQIIERAARAVGVDQILVELARMLHRLGHRRLGDRVEGDALDLLGQRLPPAQHFLDVPRNRLALAVGVGRQDQAVGGLGEVGDRLELLGLVGDNFPNPSRNRRRGSPTRPWAAGRGHGRSSRERDSPSPDISRWFSPWPAIRR